MPLTAPGNADSVTTAKDGADTAQGRERPAYVLPNATITVLYTDQYFFGNLPLKATSVAKGFLV